MSGNNERLPQTDWDNIFSSKKEIRKINLNTKFGIDPMHLLIYIITLAVSMCLVLTYFRNPSSILFTVLMSIGASGIGAALLGYFNELALKRIERDTLVKRNNDYVYTIYTNMYKIFGCQSFNYIKSISKQNGQEMFARHTADEILYQIELTGDKIEKYIFDLCYIFDDEGETMKFYLEVKDQLVHFVSSLKTNDTTVLIDSMEGIRLWLRNKFQIDNIKIHILR